MAKMNALKRLPAGTAADNTGQIPATIQRGQADTAPGPPLGFPEREKLVTEHCIKSS